MGQNLYALYGCIEMILEKIDSLNRYKPDDKIVKFSVFALMIVLALYGVLATFFFRIPYNDELLYLKETRAIYELLKSGQWIGNYPVAVHGFLFKLIPALLFFITGPSIQVATLWNVALSLMSAYLIYIIVNKKLGIDGFGSIFVLLIYVGSAQFVISFVTFQREASVIFALLLSVLLAISKRNKFLLSLALLLMLDAKEHIFFTSIPAFVLFELFQSNYSFKKRFLNSGFILFFPALYIFLSNFTSLIPLNIYIPFLFKFTKYNSLSIGSTQFINNLQEVGEVRNIRLLDYSRLISRFINPILKLIGKFLYPRTFGFLSLPLFIVLPVIFQSLLIIIRRDIKKLLFAFLVLSNVLAYILVYSHGRYLFPIFPVFGVVYLFFFNDSGNRHLIFPFIAAASGLIALYFEVTFVEIKVVLAIMLNLSFLLPHIIRKYRNILLGVHILLTGSILAMVGFAYLLSPGQNGQIIVSANTGSYYSIPELTDEIDLKDQNVVVNNSKYASVLQFYMNAYQLDYGFNHFLLKSVHPRSNKIYEYGINSQTTVRSGETDEDTDFIIELSTNSRPSVLDIGEISIPENFQNIMSKESKQLNINVFRKNGDS